MFVSKIIFISIHHRSVQNIYVETRGLRYVFRSFVNPRKYLRSVVDKLQDPKKRGRMHKGQLKKREKTAIVRITDRPWTRHSDGIVWNWSSAYKKCNADFINIDAAK